MIHAASHVDHERRVGWVSISVHACGSVSIVLVLCLVSLWAAGAPLCYDTCLNYYSILVHQKP